MYGVSIVLDQEENTDLILDSADGEFLSGIEEDISSENPSISEQRAIQIAQEYNGDPNIEEVCVICKKHRINLLCKHVHNIYEHVYIITQILWLSTSNSH